MDRINVAAFRALLDEVAAAWAACDAAAAADCFTDDAVYMEPPDQQLFAGRSELEAYFSPLEPGTYLEIHEVWFDEVSQQGAFEFTFGVAGSETADHGMVVVEVRYGRISRWREYVRKGPARFVDFLATTGKEWAWHAGNYP